MEYKNLGTSGLKVSSLCMGTMTFGDGADEATCQDIYKICRDKGINFFDCADVYADGESERILGRLVKSHRDEIVLTTKAYYPTSADINGRGNSRYHLTKAVDNSLQNLKTDHIDIFYLHCFDEQTPLEESIATLDNLIQQGKILYLGLSNFAAWQIMKAIEVSKQFSYAKIICIQPMYNLLKRQCETEILPMATYEGLGVCPYGPLAGGYLTGKYLKALSTDNRFGKDEMYQKRYEANSNKKSVEKFVNFAHENGFNPISLAIAWVTANNAVTSPLIGARNVDQLVPAFLALDLQMTDELRETISSFTPSPALATDREEERQKQLSYITQ